MTANSGATGDASASGSQWSTLDNGSQPLPINSSLVVLVHPPISAEAETTSSVPEGDLATWLDPPGPLPASVTGSDVSSSGGVDGFTSTVDDAAVESAGSVTDGPAVFLVHSDSGTGWVALQTTVPSQYASTVSSFYGPAVPVPPDPAFAEMQGTLDAEHPEFNYDIPVGPLTRSLGITVGSTVDLPAGEDPYVDNMAPVDSAGKTVEQVGPPGGAGVFPSASVLVQLHDAPAGDHIEVAIGIAEPPSSSPSSTSTTSSGLGSTVVTASATGQSVSWSVPFVVDVQRQQSLGSSTDAASVVPGTETIGTLIVAPTQSAVEFASPRLRPPPPNKTARMCSTCSLPILRERRLQSQRRS